jgi:hypothetical protein
VCVCVCVCVCSTHVRPGIRVSRYVPEWKFGNDKFFKDHSLLFELSL